MTRAAESGPTGCTRVAVERRALIPSRPSVAHTPRTAPGRTHRGRPRPDGHPRQACLTRPLSADPTHRRSQPNVNDDYRSLALSLAMARGGAIGRAGARRAYRGRRSQALLRIDPAGETWVFNDADAMRDLSSLGSAAPLSPTARVLTRAAATRLRAAQDAIETGMRTPRPHRCRHPFLPIRRVHFPPGYARESRAHHE